jgi:hypothetical protein
VAVLAVMCPPCGRSRQACYALCATVVTKHIAPSWLGLAFS